LPLAQTHGHVAKAARLLGITPKTMYNRRVAVAAREDSDAYIADLVRRLNRRIAVAAREDYSTPAKRFAGGSR
jgi:hypothetical protein